MNSIQEQIEALTQELRPYPKYQQEFWFYDAEEDEVDSAYRHNRAVDPDGSIEFLWRRSQFASTNKAEVEEYADCYRRLKLYQLLGKKAEKEFPIDFSLTKIVDSPYATDFVLGTPDNNYCVSFPKRVCVLGGVWFSREEDRLEALKICGIDKAFQEKCAKYGLGGA